MTSCYLDASALVKVATDEHETTALREHIEAFETRVTSRIATVEVPRALIRKSASSVAAVRGPWAELLDRLSLIELDYEIAESASKLPPEILRSLDAIHLASALSIRDELDAVITYDGRLAEAARAAGLTVEAPA